MNKNLFKLYKFLKSKDFVSESIAVFDLIKEAVSNFQCNSHSLGWIGPDSKFYLLPYDTSGDPDTHQSWIEQNLRVDYFDWKKSNDSFGWIKVSNSMEYFSFGREFNELDRIEAAKIFLNCMYDPDNLSYIQRQLQSPEGLKFFNFTFNVKNRDNDRYSSLKLSFFDFFDKIAMESELGSELREIFYKMIDIDIYDDKPLDHYLSQDQINSFIHFMPEEHVLIGEDELLLDDVEFFKKKEIIPPHIFNRFADDIVCRMDSYSFFRNSNYIPSDIFNKNVEEKALDLGASDILEVYYDYDSPKIPKEVFERLIIEKASDISDWHLDNYRELMSDELYSEIIKNKG